MNRMSTQDERWGRDDPQADCDALKRVLAYESRNALSRIELAASDLARFETSPSLQERVATIRAAVEEIDGCLSKIDLLSALDPKNAPPPVDLIPLARDVFARLTPSLAARGISIDFRVQGIDGGHPSNLWVAVERASVEEFLVALARHFLAVVESQPTEEAAASSWATGGAPRLAELVIEAGAEVAAVFLRLRPKTSVDGTGGLSTPVRELDRSALLDLEVSLAQQGGVLIEPSETARMSLGWALPVVAPQAGGNLRVDD